MKKGTTVLIGVIFSIAFVYGAVVEDLTQTNFDNGGYVNTTHNGSAVILSGNNLTGEYISQIFDAGSDSSWNNISWSSKTPRKDYIFGVDGGGDVYASTNSGVDWTAKAVNYGRTSDTIEMLSYGNYLYMVSNSNKEIWRSDDLGVTWNVINDSFANSNLLVGESSRNGNLFVADASGDVYLSQNNGLNWDLQGDFNGGATNNAKGMGVNSSGSIFVVDGSKAVYLSQDNGLNWVQKTSNYGGGQNTNDLEVDSNNNLYILLNKQVYKSTDEGINWDIINNSFTSFSNNGVKMLITSNDSFYIADASGRVFQSFDSGVSWTEKGDLNGGGVGSTPKGLAEFVRTTNLTFQAKSCDDSSCLGELFEGPFGTNELPDNQFNEQTHNSNGSNMQGNVLLMHLNDLSGNPIDSSGQSNTVSLIRSATYGSEGKFNTSLKFDGIDGTIDLDYNDTNFNFSRSGEFTVSAWVKPIGLHQGGDSDIISHYRSSTNNRVWSLQIRNNVTRFVACSNGNLSSCVYATSTTKIEIGNWYFVAGKWDGSNIGVYVNGISEDTSPFNSLHSTNDTGVRIARSASITGETWLNGSIDEVAIWNRSLSDNEIKNIYNKGNSNKFYSSPSFLSLQNNRYFQYKSFFTSEEENLTSELFNTSVDYSILDASAPNITIISPLNQNYTNATILVNISARDDFSLGSVWFYNGSANVSYSNETLYTFSQGTTNLIAYANDSLNNLNSSSVTFFVDSIAPIVAFGTGTETEGLSLSRDWIYVNVSVTESNENSITFRLFNSTSLVNESTFNDGTREINWTGLANEEYSYNVSVNDTLNNVGISETRNLTLDNLFPLVNLVFPVANNYSSNVMSLNYTVAENNIDSCWYTLNGGIVNVSLATCGENVSGISSEEGSNTWEIYVNDTAGNENSSSVTFFVDSISPSVSVVQPTAKTYGANTSLPLNFTVSDSGIGLDSCWFNVMNSTNAETIANTTLVNCQNTTFDVGQDDIYTLNLFANDSLGNKNNKSVEFSVVTTVPALNLLSPSNNSYLDYEGDVYLNYSVVSGVGISSCQLLGDFDGSWGINQTNSSITLEDNFFILNLTEGNYNWGIVCNDTQDRTSAVNRTFTIDVTSPDLTLTEPTGTKTSRTGIPVTFSVSDTNLDSCWFNVFEGITQKVVNTSVDCSSGSGSFDVTSDADFILNFFANDSAGNSNSTNSSFTIDTSTTPPQDINNGGGGGGSGGGGTIPKKIYNKSTQLKIDFLGPEQFFIKRGTNEIKNLQVTNKEKIFLNNCSLTAKGPEKSWLNNKQIKGLGAGEKFTFNINVSIPENAKPGIYNIESAMQCDEGKAQEVLTIVTFRNIFEAKILDYEKEGNKLKVSYSLQEFAGEAHQLTLTYSLVDFENVPRYRGQDSTTLEPKTSAKKTIEFNLPKDSFGEFDFEMSISDGISEISVNKSMFLPSQGGLTGRVIPKDIKTRLSWLGVVAVIIIIFYFIVRLTYKFRRNTKKIGKPLKKNKKFIDLKL